ncbi:hypothetical protein SBA7_360018 [Candidatus Sulfotelmatobacter sp. SbA7]|nr:hypothetical protein SBA7_360018 [Candidatus Sulfotelmatobacter sp. SbA7]
MRARAWRAAVGVRETISEMRYPALVNCNASAVPSLPGPTIAMLGFAGIDGSIAGRLVGRKSRCEQAQRNIECCSKFGNQGARAGNRDWALYCWNGKEHEGACAVLTSGLPRTRFLGHYRPSARTQRSAGST